MRKLSIVRMELMLSRFPLMAPNKVAISLNPSNPSRVLIM